MNAVEKIDKQIELELSASALYRKLDENTEDAELKRLWSTLAVHEEYHAASLESLKASLSPEELENEASTLDEENINGLLQKHEEFMKAIKEDVSPSRAFEIAMFLEFSELNSLFFNAMRSGEEDRAPYLHSLAEGTKSHLMTLYRGVKKHLGEKEQAPYLEMFTDLGLMKE